MTIKERVQQIVNGDPDLSSETPATLEKLVAMAYYIGRESAAKEVSDMYNRHLSAQRERAEKCRYHYMAEQIIGPEKYLYHPDYAGDMTSLFGGDVSDITVKEA